MAGIRIDTEKCVGCGTCADVCTSGALSVEDGCAKVLADLCVACGVCVSSCPVEAISADTGAVSDKKGSVAVFAERKNGVFLSVAGELLGKGRELADALGVPLIAIAVGNGAEPPETEAAYLGAYGADRYILQPGTRFDAGYENDFRDAMCDILREEQPAVLLLGATLFGRGMAPGVAAKLQTGLTADCTMLDIDRETGLLVQTRPAFGGNLMASIVCANHRPQMATVRPGVMRCCWSPDRPAAALTVLPALDGTTEAYTVLDTAVAETRESIADAKIILDCGRGIGSKKNLKLVKALAERLGAAVGCTRPLVDTGICEYSSQIGQTGTTVAPDLLILLGVSGAVQHIAGIGGAKKIIAVNTDPDAPVFASADVKIVADCMEIVKKMLVESEK